MPSNLPICVQIVYIVWYPIIAETTRSSPLASSYILTGKYEKQTLYPRYFFLKHTEQDLTLFLRVILGGSRPLSHFSIFI